MKKFLFVDLDDTLFQTLEKCGNAPDLQAHAFLKDGSPISYSTRKQRALFSMFDESMTLIPSTARDLNSFQRVNLDFTSYAVLNYGGVILNPDGTADQTWLRRTQGEMQVAMAGLEDIIRHIDDYAKRTGFGGRARVIEDFDTPFFVVLKDPQKNPGKLAEFDTEVVQPWLASVGSAYYLHRNGNNLAVLPKTLSKSHAVKYLQDALKEQHGDILSFGMGDSKSDAAFMSLCDYAIIPRQTQLARHALEPL